MSHSDVRNQMPDYLEGDLSLDRRALFDAHLDECPECAREIAEMRMTIGALRSLPAPEPPPMLVADVMRRIRLGEGQETFFDRLRALADVVLAPRVLAPVSVAAIAAGILLGTEPLRDGMPFGLDPASLVVGEAPPGTIVVARTDPQQPSERDALPAVPSMTSAGALAGIPGGSARTPGQELIALSELLAERSRRSHFSDWSSLGSLASAGAGVGAPGVTVATRSGDAAFDARGGTAYLPSRPAEAEERWPSADEWLAHVELQPVDFADQMVARSLAEREHWIDSLARRAVETERLDRVVSALRQSRSRTAHVLADDFASAGARHGGTLSASHRTD